MHQPILIWLKAAIIHFANPGGISQVASTLSPLCVTSALLSISLCARSEIREWSPQSNENLFTSAPRLIGVWIRKRFAPRDTRLRSQCLNWFADRGGGDQDFELWGLQSKYPGRLNLSSLVCRLDALLCKPIWSLSSKGALGFATVGLIICALIRNSIQRKCNYIH